MSQLASNQQGALIDNAGDSNRVAVQPLLGRHLADQARLLKVYRCLGALQLSLATCKQLGQDTVYIPLCPSVGATAEVIFKDPEGHRLVSGLLLRQPVVHLLLSTRIGILPVERLSGRLVTKRPLDVLVAVKGTLYVVELGEGVLDQHAKAAVQHILCATSIEIQLRPLHEHVRMNDEVPQAYRRRADVVCDSRPPALGGLPSRRRSTRFRSSV